MPKFLTKNWFRQNVFLTKNVVQMFACKKIQFSHNFSTWCDQSVVFPWSFPDRFLDRFLIVSWSFPDRFMIVSWPFHDRFKRFFNETIVLTGVLKKSSTLKTIPKLISVVCHQYFHQWCSYFLFCLIQTEIMWTVD